MTILTGPRILIVLVSSCFLFYFYFHQVAQFTDISGHNSSDTPINHDTLTIAIIAVTLREDEISIPDGLAAFLPMYGVGKHNATSVRDLGAFKMRDSRKIQDWARLSMQSLRKRAQFTGRVVVLTNEPDYLRSDSELYNVELIDLRDAPVETNVMTAKFCKTQLMSLIPDTPYLLYIDVDILVVHPLDNYFNLLEKALFEHSIALTKSKSISPLKRWRQPYHGGLFAVKGPMATSNGGHHVGQGDKILYDWGATMLRGREIYERDQQPLADAISEYWRSEVYATSPSQWINFPGNCKEVENLNITQPFVHFTFTGRKECPMGRLSKILTTQWGLDIEGLELR